MAREVKKYKAQFVARDLFREIDFNETFSPTAHPVSVRALVSLAVMKDWSLSTSDVRTAYLNAQLEKPVYLRQPKGLELGNKVMSLKKCLDSLKISAKQWHETFIAKIKEFGFKAVTSDDCMFTITCGDDVLHIVIVVDDILQATINEEFRKEFIVHLRTSFDVSEDGELDYFLGIGYTRLLTGRCWHRRPVS